MRDACCHEKIAVSIKTRIRDLIGYQKTDKTAYRGEFAICLQAKMLSS
jgi:hypothetical protein